MDPHNLSQADILSIVSLKYARNEVLEPPWYGFFGIVLRGHMSGVEDNVATPFILQLPITVEDDDINIDDDNVSGDGMREITGTTPRIKDMNPPPTRATDVESFQLVSHALTEEGDIHLIFNISLLMDVAQNQFVHDPRQKKNLQFLIGLNQRAFQAKCLWQTANASSPCEFLILFVDDFTWTRI